MKSKLKKISFDDICGIFKFIIIFLPAILYKLSLKIKHKKTWLICEKRDMARDNGYVFYKYMKANHPEITCFYAIDFKSFDYKKLIGDKNVINWSSFKHYFYYIVSDFNISSHKEGNPNQTLFTIIHLYFHLLNNRVFLQHGVLYTDMEMFHKNNTYFKLFCTGAITEYQFVKEKYGYSDEVVYTGLARFDDLHSFTVNKHQILYMPTWRRQFDDSKKFLESKYYNGINDFLNDEKLEKFLEEKDLELLFYIHTGNNKYKEFYHSNSNRIKFATVDDSDVQELLKSSALMITDYSSVATDFAYMKKPIIYYQYDESDYITHVGNYNTYFSYYDDGFGPVVSTKENLIKELVKCYNDQFNNEKIYIDRVNDFFKLHDKNNCKRIYSEIERLYK